MPKNVLITGAATGLGLALAKRFLDKGYHVYGVSRTKRHWRKALLETGGASKRFYLTCLDVSRESGVRSLTGRIFKKAGCLDVVINNAGYANAPSNIERDTLKNFQHNLKANLISVFLVSKYAIPYLKKQRQALIVNISSMAGKRAVPGLAAYSASKFGVLAISQSIAKENPGGRLKCFTVCPGGMNTDMRALVFGREDAAKQQSPEFVADVIMKAVDGRMDVESGGDIVIRHGKITAINPAPLA